MFKKVTLLRQINIFVLLAVFIPSITTALICYYSEYELLRSEKIHEVGANAQSRANELTTVLNRARTRAEKFAADLEARCQTQSDTPQCLRQSLNGYTVAERAVGAIYKSQAFNHPLSVGNPDVELDHLTPLKPGQVASFTQNASLGKWLYHFVIADSVGAPILVLTYPADLLQIWFENTNEELGMSGEAFLSNEDGSFITKPRYASPKGLGLSHHTSVKPMETCLSNHNGVDLNEDYRGIDVIHGFRYIPEIGGGCVMVHMEQAEAFAPLRSIGRNFLVTTLGFSVLAMLAGWLTSRKVVAPILALTKSVKEVMAGNYQAKVAVPLTSELGELAQMFNLMTDTLGNSFSDLKTANTRLSEVNQLNDQIMSSAQEGIVAYDSQMRITAWNDFMVTMTGVSREDCLGQKATDLFPFLANAGINAGVDKALAGETVHIGPYYWDLPHTGRAGWASNLMAPLRHQDGTIIGIIKTISDVTSLVHAEDAKELAHLVFKNSSEGMIVTNDNNEIIATNPAFTQLTGYSETEVLGKNPSFLKSERQDSAFYKSLWTRLIHKGHWAGEIWNKRKDGEVYAEWLTINTIYNVNGTVHRRVGLFSDITKRKQSEELIWQQANYDSLTGLPNRRMFHDRLELAIKKAKRSGMPLALMFIDLDHFKEINDVFGHEIGDMLLKEASRRLMGSVRTSDTVARLGGDEFTIVLDELSETDNINHVINDVLRELSAPFQLGNDTGYVSASIGVTYYPQDANNADDLIKNADQAMYAAKNKGRNCAYFYDTTLQEIARSRMKLITDMHTALHDNQFALHYQPIINMDSVVIEKAEALVRWHHPERGLLGPDEFIYLAEESGLIVELGTWVMRTACAQNMEWRQQGRPPIRITVNVSARQFQGGTLPTMIRDVLEDTCLPADGLEIEITEGMLMDNTMGAIATLQKLRVLGVHISEDDFGTGYSSLSYLKQFPIHTLKIDQSFVRDLTSDPNDVSLVSAIIAMANSLHLNVVAEGVETKEQLAILQQKGCSICQGFLMGRPMTNLDFETFMDASEREQKSV